METRLKFGGILQVYCSEAMIKQISKIDRCLVELRARVGLYSGIFLTHRVTNDVVFMPPCSSVSLSFGLSIRPAIRHSGLVQGTVPTHDIYTVAVRASLAPLASSVQMLPCHCRAPWSKYNRLRSYRKVPTAVKCTVVVLLYWALFSLSTLNITLMPSLWCH